MKQNLGIDFRPETHEWDDLILLIDDEVQKDMENRLISAADLQEAIWLAENNNDKFYDERDGVCICSIVKPFLTYWVQYKKIAQNTHRIFSVYYHRMRFNREEPTA
jgi:hypothetical protein